MVYVCVCGGVLASCASEWDQMPHPLNRWMSSLQSTVSRLWKVALTALGWESGVWWGSWGSSKDGSNWSNGLVSCSSGTMSRASPDQWSTRLLTQYGMVVMSVVSSTMNTENTWLANAGMIGVNCVTALWHTCTVI